MDPKIFIVVPVYNRLDIVRNYLANIERQTYNNIEVIIVDDNSSDGTPERIRKEYDSLRLKIIETEGDEWWGGSVRIGIDYVTEHAKDDDCILLMNDDVNFDPDLCKKFVNAHKDKQNAVLSGIEIVEGEVKPTGTKMICWPLAITRRPYAGHEWPSEDLPDSFEVDFLGARASFYPISIVKDIGNIASDKLPHYHADGEYSYRAVRNGYNVYVITDIPIYSNPETTGLFNSWTNEYTWEQLLPSFFEFKSINNIKHRWEFAKLCSPKIWLYPYFISHVSKAFIRSVFMILKSKITFFKK